MFSFMLYVSQQETDHWAYHSFEGGSLYMHITIIVMQVKEKSSGYSRLSCSQARTKTKSSTRRYNGKIMLKCASWNSNNFILTSLYILCALDTGEVTVSDECFALLILWNIENTRERILQDHQSESMSVASNEKLSDTVFDWNIKSKVSGSEGNIGWNDSALKKYSVMHQKVQQERTKHNRKDIYPMIHKEMTKMDPTSKSTKYCKNRKKTGIRLDDDVCWEVFVPFVTRV